MPPKNKKTSALPADAPSDEFLSNVNIKDYKDLPDGTEFCIIDVFDPQVQNALGFVALTYFDGDKWPTILTDASAIGELDQGKTKPRDGFAEPVTVVKKTGSGGTAAAVTKKKAPAAKKKAAKKAPAKKTATKKKPAANKKKTVTKKK